jgi:hypothetical protein
VRAVDVVAIVAIIELKNSRGIPELCSQWIGSFYIDFDAANYFPVVKSLKISLADSR